MEGEKNPDSSLLKEASSILGSLLNGINRIESAQSLSGPYDKRGARLTITAGAGGQDAQDWADMLLRMYTRWGESQGFKTQVVDISAAEGAGIKSASIEFEGRYAYGNLAGEKGTHRLVRLSPFNAKALRQVNPSCGPTIPIYL